LAARNSLDCLKIRQTFPARSWKIERPRLLGRLREVFDCCATKWFMLRAEPRPSVADKGGMPLAS
jgi:hypothetical protein